jgi:ferrous iron transport protein A
MAAESLPLTSLKLGDAATVSAIKLQPEQRGRLLEMGLLVGTSVQLIRFAPLGDPVEIKVRGYHLTLRRHDAEQIWVCPENLGGKADGPACAASTQ